MRLTLLFFGVILFGCFIQTQDALFTGGKSLQEHFESLLQKSASKTSNKLQAWLDVLKEKRYANLIWRGYRKYYKKNYTSKAEEKERFGKFIDNLKLIIQENFRCDRGNKSFRMKINEYGDMSIDEFKKKMTGLNDGTSPGAELTPGAGDDPSTRPERRRRSLFDSVKKKLKDKIKKKIKEKIDQYSVPGGGSHPSGGGSYPSGGGSYPSGGGSYPSRDGSYSFTVISRPVTRKPTGVLSKASVDYRSYMNPIENQGRCGSCYAFAVTAAIEGTHALKSGQRVKLSKQELIDCSGNNGCQGGYLGATYKYVKEQRGLEQDTSYPYKMTAQGVCRKKSSRFGGITGYDRVQQGDEEAMKQALIKYGPLAAAIHTTSDLQFYAGSSGRRGSDIIDIPFCSKQVDHAIVIVGFGTEDGKDYWIVRNSWGPKWGLDGYFKIARNKNMCGIGTYGYYAIV